MVHAAFKAFGDLISSDFRSVLWKAIGLSLALFIAVFAAVEAMFWFFTLVRWPWVETILAVGAGLGMLVLFFFLMAPVTSIFAGLYLDSVASKVEARHYPGDVPGVPLSTFTAMLTAVQFALLVLFTNILALPLVFTGFGVVALFIINAYLISREYFEMVAMRFMPPDKAKALRKEFAAQVFVSGFIPAVLSAIPVINLTVPLFATSYFVHIFKQVRVSLA